MIPTEYRPDPFSSCSRLYKPNTFLKGSPFLRDWKARSKRVNTAGVRVQGTPNIGSMQSDRGCRLAGSPYGSAYVSSEDLLAAISSKNQLHVLPTLTEERVHTQGAGAKGPNHCTTTRMRFVQLKTIAGRTCIQKFVASSPPAQRLLHILQQKLGLSDVDSSKTNRLG